jgi:N-acetylmuramoyl-L-alanine amidase
MRLSADSAHNPARRGTESGGFGRSSLCAGASKAPIAVSILLLAAGCAFAQPHNSVTAVRHWSVGGVTRVAIEVSGQFQVTGDRVHNPERVYFDLPDTRPLLGQKLFAQEINEKLLKRVRVAETAPGVTRVVLELGNGVEATQSQLTNPYRLMVELRTVGPVSGPPTGPEAAPPVILEPAPVIPVRVPPAPKLPPGDKPRPPRIRPTPAAKTVVTVTAPPVTAEPGKKEISVREPIPDAAPQLAQPPESRIEMAKLQGPPPVAPANYAGAKSARPTSSGQNSLTRVLGLKINRIVIDPGHGGQNDGATGAKGLVEKDLVLDVSLRLGKLISERMGSEVIYTRSDDTFVPLEARTALANDKKADLFLSIHANWSPAPVAAGIETYYLNFTDSQDALNLAARENATSQKSIFELHDLIEKISLHDKLGESREFAGRIQSSLYALSSRNNPEEKNRGVRRAPFVVLIGANMPSVLAEIGFLSNPKEETLLKKPEYRQKIAEALFKGVSRYSEGLSHVQVASK